MVNKKDVRVGAAQIPAYGLERAGSALVSIERAIEQTAEQRVDLLVLPECAYPAYLIGSVEAYRKADVLPADEYIIKLARLARKKKVHIVSGFVEDVGTHLHNSAVLIDDQGQEVGRYRKSFLWANDNEWFKPGDRVPVFQTRLGRIGMVICADTRAPEIIAKLVRDGAELVAMPTCWINAAADRGRFENPQPEFLISARAKEFGVPFVCANKFGMETAKIGYCGRSLIAAADGRILKEAPGDSETLIVGEIELRGEQEGDVHGELWESLVSWDEPVRPEPKMTSRVRVAIWPERFLSLGEFDRLRADGVRLLVISGVADERIMPTGGVELVTSEHAGALRSSVVGTIGCLSCEQFRNFGRTRLLALGGAEMVCVFGAPGDMRLLRTRAAENRVFVLAVGEWGGAIISPAGEVLACSSDKDQRSIVADIRIADAANKTVAPGTDIWEQRRVNAYK